YTTPVASTRETYPRHLLLYPIGKSIKLALISIVKLHLVKIMSVENYTFSLFNAILLKEAIF
uniref:hypothetical protein n=1 Tax=Okeania sp. SIO2F4 TaxID=2607790 RepID=UPI0025FB4C44